MLTDPESKFFFQQLKFIYANRPYRFFLGNSERLCNYQEGRSARAVVDLIAEWGYAVHHHVVKSHCLGLPTHRNRLLIVGLHTDLNPRDMEGPQSCSFMAIAALLDDRSPSDDATRNPGIEGGSIRAGKVRNRIVRDGGDPVHPDWVVNSHHSISWSLRASSKPSNFSPRPCTSTRPLAWVERQRCAYKRSSQAHGVC